MEMPLDKLKYKFRNKPLLIGGKAMEYYGLRKAGADIDLVISSRDHVKLSALYPNNIKDLSGDLGICEYGFEIWNQICRFNYEFLRVGAVEENEYLISSLHRLLFLKTLAIKQQKYYNDVLLIVERIIAVQYGKA